MAPSVESSLKDKIEEEQMKREIERQKETETDRQTERQRQTDKRASQRKQGAAGAKNREGNGEMSKKISRR